MDRVHSHVAVVDQKHDPLSVVCATDAQVAELSLVAKRHLAVVHPVEADAEFAGVSDGQSARLCLDTFVESGLRGPSSLGPVRANDVVVLREDVESLLEGGDRTTPRLCL